MSDISKLELLKKNQDFINLLIMLNDNNSTAIAKLDSIRTNLNLPSGLIQRMLKLAEVEISKEIEQINNDLKNFL